jgi:hypothetical protein
MFWPLPLSVLIGLTLWGLWRQGPWLPPALCALGYLGARGVMNFTPEAAHEVALCALWLCLAACLLYLGAKVPAFFVVCSAMAYPALMLIGLRIEWMGAAPIVAEVCMALAMLAMGGSIHGSADPRRDLAPDGPAGIHDGPVAAAPLLARG